jgi:hypothetical protein
MTESRIFWRLRARLDDAKRAALANVTRRAKRAEKAPHLSPAYLATLYPDDWREIARADAKRRYGRGSPWNPGYTDKRGRAWRWLERVDGSGLAVAVENATDRQNGHRCSGYYVDTFGDGEAQHGAVLIAGREESPRARYFAAISDPHNDGAFRVYWTPCDNLDDAAALADSLAERDAESQREYDAAWQAGSLWADLGEEVKQDRAALLAILGDRKAATGSATLCAVIREKVDDLLESIRDARAKRDRLAEGDGASNDDFYRTFWDGDADLRAAFNEGAGRQVLA